MSEAGEQRKTRSYVPITAPRAKPANAAVSSQRLPAQNEPPAQDAAAPASPESPAPSTGSGRVPASGSGRVPPAAGSGRQRPPYPPRPQGAQPGVPDSSTRHYIQMGGSSTRMLRDPEQTKRLDPKSISIRAPGGPISARPSALAIGCKQCGRPLPAELLNRLPMPGRANKTLICPACEIINAEKRRVQRRNLMFVGAGVCAGLAALGAVFPQTALFVFAATGFLSIAGGVLGFTWERVVRLVLIAGGLSVMLASVALLWTLQDRAAERAATQDAEAKAAAVVKFLDENRYLEAHEAHERLLVEVRDQPERYGSNEIRAIVSKAREELDGWVERHYGNLTPEGRQLLLSLMRIFPITPGMNGQRVLSLQVQDGEVALTMVLPAAAYRSPGTVRSNDPRANEARMILVSIFDGIPNVEAVRLTLVPQDQATPATSPRNAEEDSLASSEPANVTEPAERSEPTVRAEGGTYIVKKEQAVSLRMGEPPQREQDRPK